MIDRQRLSSVAHSHHPIAAPVSGVSVNRILRRADRRPAARILDLGCGEAAWALQALTHYPDGHADGILLAGEGFWQVPPTPAALAALDAVPEDFTDLAGLVDVAERAGWTPVYAHVSDAAEWDNYEWSWVGSLTEWALDNPGHPDAAAAGTLAREHREQWLRGYRGVLGFVTLVLRRM